MLCHASKETLHKIMRSYGGVPHSKKIAADIVESRYLMTKLDTVHRLKDFLWKAHRRMAHVKAEDGAAVDETVRKVHDALRRFVNDELNELDYTLKLAHMVLADHGLLVVVTRSRIEESIVHKLLFDRVEIDAVANRRSDVFKWKSVQSKSYDDGNVSLFAFAKT